MITISLKTIVAIFTPISFLMTFVLFIVYNYNIWKFQKYLEKHHPDTWVSLGSPSLFANNSVQNSRRFLNFLKKKNFEKVENLIIVRKASKCRKLFFSYALSFLIFAILIFTVVVIP